MLLAYYISKTTALEHISYVCEQEYYTFCFQPGFQVGQHLQAVNVKPGSRLIYRSCWYRARNQHTYKYYLAKIYTLWGIAFARVFDYNSSQEEMLISTPLTNMSTDRCHV